MARKPLPSQERLRELFDLDPMTGRLYNKVTRSSKAVAGQMTGSVRPDGYWTVYFDGRSYQQHNIVYKWVTGMEPPVILDHADDDKGNNAFWNLRPVTYNENVSKARGQEKTSGMPAGVVERTRKTCVRYEAKIVLDGKISYLGCFSTPEEASAAYQTVLKGGKL